MPAIPYVKTAVDKDAWDGPAAVTRLKNNKSDLRAAFAWVDPKGDPSAKASYKFPHHDIAPDGSTGAANLTACSAVIGVLNGGRGGADIPDSDRQAVYDAVAAHLKDGGVKPPPLKGASSSAQMLAAKMKQ